MSYCRKGDDSDVYVLRFGYPKDLYVCINCCRKTKIFLAGPKDARAYGPEEMLKHLEYHIENGDKVPNTAIQRLKNEIETRRIEDSFMEF
jgi:hypothetical protein